MHATCLIRLPEVTGRAVTIWHVDESQYQRAVERLTKVNDVIAKLEPAIQSEAFSILKPWVVAEGGDGEAEAGTGGGGETEHPKPRGGPVDYDVLIEKHESDKDYENATLALAIVYDRHGRGPFDLQPINAVAKEFNLTIPKRLDKFLNGAKRDGNEVLRKQAEGWKVTPSGEKWLKGKYGVTRGKKPLATEAS